MFKSLQILNTINRNIDLTIKPRPIQDSINQKKTLNEKQDKPLIQRNFIIGRKTCTNNLQMNNRLSQRIQVKILNTPKKFIIKKKIKNKIIENDKNKGIERNDTLKNIEKSLDGQLQDQDQIITNKKIFKRKEEKDMREQFKTEVQKRRLENQIDLHDKIDKVKKYEQQRMNFMNYLTYLIHYINSNKNDKSEEVKVSTLFRAVQIFDNYLVNEDKTLQQQEIFATTQACILLASKLQDIYYIDVDQIEFDSDQQQLIFQQEHRIVSTLHFKLYHSTEFDFLFISLSLFPFLSQSIQYNSFFKATLKNLIIFLRDYQCRLFNSNVISQTVIMYTFVQYFPDQFNLLQNVILQYKWDQVQLQSCTKLLQNNLDIKQTKFIENVDKILSYI